MLKPSDNGFLFDEITSEAVQTFQQQHVEPVGHRIGEHLGPTNAVLLRVEPDVRSSRYSAAIDQPSRSARGRQTAI